MGPGRDRDRVRLSKSPSQARENDLLGTRKGRGHGHGNGHGHHFEHRRQGSRRDKGRHGKGKLTDPNIQNIDRLGSTAVLSSVRQATRSYRPFSQNTLTATWQSIDGVLHGYSRSFTDVTVNFEF